MSNLKFPSFELDAVHGIGVGVFAYKTTLQREVRECDTVHTIEHHDSVIAKVYTDNSSLSDEGLGLPYCVKITTAGFDTKTTADRLNRIVCDITRGTFKAGIRAGDTCLLNKCCQIIKSVPGHKFMTIYLAGGEWYLAEG